MIYRWRGVTRNGVSCSGQAEFGHRSALGAMTAARFRSGWRELTVTEGPGPVPPGRDEEPVARIDRTADRGQRVWWAES